MGQTGRVAAAVMTPNSRYGQQQQSQSVSQQCAGDDGRCGIRS